METYVGLLSQIYLLRNQVVSESIMTDSEQSMIKAIAQVYLLTLQNGWLFHLSKSIYCKVQGLELSYQYDALNNHAVVEEQAVLDYFERNYIYKLRRGRHLEPRYPHTLWNMSLRVHKNLSRTSNDLEGFHNQFSSSFMHCHTHVWKFIEWFLTTFIIESFTDGPEMIAGVPNSPQQLIYREVNERI